MFHAQPWRPWRLPGPHPETHPRSPDTRWPGSLAYPLALAVPGGYDKPGTLQQSRATGRQGAQYLGQGGGQDTAAVWAAIVQVRATPAVAAALETASASRESPEIPAPGIHPSGNAPAPVPGRRPASPTLTPANTPRRRRAGPQHARGECGTPSLLWYIWTREMRQIEGAAAGHVL